MDVSILEKLIARANRAMGKKDPEETAKTLTTKDRKKLQKGTFCGPNRSFPVPDCQHVATAKAYLNRSNFSKATKQKIAACINRKAKSLGCGEGKPAKAKSSYTEYSYETLTQEQQALYNSDIFAETRALVESSIENPGMELDWSPTCKKC